MKKIILRSSFKKEVFLNELVENDFVGVIYNDEQNRGYITKLSEGVFVLNDLGDNDFSKYRTYESPQAILSEYFINESYVFNTQKELIEWLNGKN